ncbi:nitroreductase family protein [Dactylosporangium fulvum]|uniref:Nitroreductase family protein n=1 Tax=Dactylosporangium fulvum TaxID=53359 RepID=A0ABY5WC23_9ACTN|nr:nitroreductase family protein [Dactylosporangium fulvum]UWP87072.1 nitroreductase family protein [Dactylosporangium fulvum]
MNRDALEVIRTRRVVRAMTDEPVPRDQVERILDAAAHAPSAGNRRLQRFVAVDDAATLRVLRMVSPGMLQRPAAAVVICVDVARAAGYGFRETSSGLSIDVGTAAQTMLLAAHALGLGSGPVTSFSRAAVGVVLNLPAGWRPELIVCLGHAAAAQPPPVAPNRRYSWRDLTSWGRLADDDVDDRA